MKKEIINEIKQMQKLMIYNWAKTDTENTKIFEQIVGTPPDASGGGSGSGGSGGSGRRYSSPTPTIPTELANAEGVKKFQDWLDQNKAGWATGYSGGILSKAGGYGRFGPRTSKAWESYKSEYQSGSSISGDDIIDVDDIQGQPSGQVDVDDIQGQPAGQTTQQPAGQPSGDVADITVPKGAPVVPSQDELPN